MTADRCPHPEIKMGKYLINDVANREHFYCLCCGEDVDEFQKTKAERDRVPSRDDKRKGIDTTSV